MFAESKKNRVEPLAGQTNRIVENTIIKGDLISEADIRIDGELEGSITAKGKVVIGRAGKVSGKIQCMNADIEGKFDGDLKVENVLSLKGTAVIEGDVVVGKLAVEPGATFNAACSMKGASLKTVNDNGQKQPKADEKSA
ncbi:MULTISPECIES: bactofilin family protein [Galbibacter]|uniref:Integral membrane protein CcmA involved in cell shape determination n=1 Tax=Galbibacter orientalis DSM 19592 TaxID=926559 RepID=I3C436_9FLAO|nr:polymer-forming cytoskeletal protein [Galbibacter orientalis]EIJ38379.1 Integral membrane protein CcmA involved in cell shape determination [Galbibacter orientalis DSM 19592]